MTVAHQYKFLLQTVKSIETMKLIDPSATSSPSSATTPNGSGNASDASGEAAIAIRKSLAQNAWNFVNDSLRTTLCLQVHIELDVKVFFAHGLSVQYEPRLIALAALDLASNLNGLDLSQPGSSRRW